MNQSRLTTVALTVLRVVLGFLFAAHGWQKFNEWTIAGTQASFAKMGVPAADVMAPAVAVLELAGGIALILGILTRVVAALLVLDMLGRALPGPRSRRRLRGERRLRTGPAPGCGSLRAGTDWRGPPLRGPGTVRPRAPPGWPCWPSPLQSSTRRRRPVTVKYPAAVGR